MPQLTAVSEHAGEVAEARNGPARPRALPATLHVEHVVLATPVLRRLVRIAKLRGGVSQQGHEQPDREACTAEKELQMPSRLGAVSLERHHPESHGVGEDDVLTE